MRLARSEDLKGELLSQIVNRGRLGLESVEKDVTLVIESVRVRGDKALFEFTQKFDRVELDPSTVRATQEDIKAAYSLVQKAEVKALRKAASNIERFHEMQLKRLSFEEFIDEIEVGVITRPISAVGIYAPGGRTSYPSSVLMCAIPAKVAGVEQLILCSPPSQRGRFNPYVLVASDIAEVDEVFCVGGAQAIAAMAYGTETIKPVNKIVGPGNIYVTAAKQLLSRHVSTDPPAGPTEILVIADARAEPQFIAADLLAQAEHDENAFCVMLTDSERIAVKVKESIDKTLENTSTTEPAKIALEKRGLIIVVKDLQEAVALANLVAPEHLVIMTKKPQSLLREVRNAGLVFLGEYSPVALGDYCAGTNHVLPTGGYAKTYSGLSVRDFLKTISYVNCSKKGLMRLAGATTAIAKIENLHAHSRSITVRDT